MEKNRAQSTVKRQVPDDFIFSRAALSRLFRWQKPDVIIVETRQHRYGRRLSFETSCFRRDSTLSYRVRNFIIIVPLLFLTFEYLISNI